MDDIARDQRAHGQTPAANAERALDAVRFAYPGEVPEGIDIAELGDHCHEQVADLITDLLLLVGLAGEDVDEVLDTARMHYDAERD